MHNRDLDKNISSGDVSSSSRKRSSTGSGSSAGSSSSGSYGSGSDQMRNREESSEMFESGEELQRQQSEGNLGNERNRNRPDSSSDDMRGVGDE